MALCPKYEDHANYPKRMFYMVDDGLYLFCKRHQWIKFEFIKDGRKIDFKDVKVIAQESKIKNFEEESLGILAYGRFDAKRSKRSRNVPFNGRDTDLSKNL